MSIVPYTPAQLRMRLAEKYPEKYPIKPAFYYWYPPIYPYGYIPPFYPHYYNPYSGYVSPAIYRPVYPWPTAYYI